MGSLHAALLATVLSGVGGGETVLLDFYSDSCPPCRAMDPVVRELMDKGYTIQRVNVTRQPDLARQFRVSGIPCFVMIVDGKEKDRIVGATSRDRLEQLCKLGKSAAPSRAPGLLARLGGARKAADNSATNRPALAAVPRSPAGGPGAGGARAAADPFRRPNEAGTASVGASDARLLASTVRLRIEDPNGHSWGTGAIIDSRKGEALILTCGHIFRDSKGQGKIEVDLFGPNPARRIPGRLIACDLTRDIGLVAIYAPRPLTVARVAPPGYQIRPGDAVASAGCNNGDDPTVQRSQVIFVNKCLGWPNVHVAGRPVQGRSGGPLFSSTGQVIGVCNADDKEHQAGLFASIQGIQAQLDEASLACVYKEPAPVAAAAASVAQADPAIWHAPPTAPPVQLPPADATSRSPAPAEVARGAAAPAGLAPDEQAAMDEIHRRLKQGAEIVIIARDRDNPQAKSDVFMLDRASPAFVGQLKAEARSQDSLQETSLDVPRVRKPILEWDVQDGYRHGGPMSAAR